MSVFANQGPEPAHGGSNPGREHVFGLFKRGRIRRSGARGGQALLTAFLLVLFTGCEPQPSDEAPADQPDEDLTFDAGTEEDRAALFDYLVEKTMERDAFASLSEHPLYDDHPKGIDVVAGMERHRDALINAETDEKMWLALQKMSNARKDRHLSLGTVDGGLEVPDEMISDDIAPIRFLVDYSDLDHRYFFVSDLGERIDEYVEGGTVPQTGDRVVAINGMSGSEYIENIRPYWRYSSENRLWLRVSEIIGEKRSHVPHDLFYREELELVLERPGGERYQVSLPYMQPDEIDWQLHEEQDHLDWDRYFTREYPDFSREPEMDEWETFNLFISDDPQRPVVLVQWYGFRGDLRDAMDALMAYAEREDLLGHDVVVDATRSRGGSNGAYALARLQPEKFRTTKHNLMISDVSEEWVRSRLDYWQENPPEPERGQSSVNEMEWLERDVIPAIDQDYYYTNDVPFKGVQPPWGDATIEPADTHFTGDMVVWMSPRGGSHLDQFAAQVVDNDLAHMMGMASGGFSNSWSTTTTLRFPTTGRPIAEYEWSMGHSIRPNGEILQYNAAEPHEYIPWTRDNMFNYYEMLTERTLEHLGYR